MKSINARLKNKKGQMIGLVPGIIGLVVAILVLVMGLVVIQEIRDVDIISNTGAAWCNATETTMCGTAFSSANASLVGLGDFSDFVPIIVIALAASVIIGLILIGFAFSRRSR